MTTPLLCRVCGEPGDALAGATARYVCTNDDCLRYQLMPGYDPPRTLPTEGREFEATRAIAGVQPYRFEVVS